MEPGDEITTAPLCCIVNPWRENGDNEYTEGYAWCVYCGFHLCERCMDMWLSPTTLDKPQYYHHEECLDKCSCAADFHESSRKTRRLL